VQFTIRIAVAAFAVMGGAVVADAAQPTRAAQWAQLGSLPDWSGIWEVDWRNVRRSPPRAPMKLTPEYQKRLDVYRAAQKDGENLQSEAANCVPTGMPGIMTQPYPIEFLYQPGKVVILTETFMQYRHVFTDGRKLPEDPDPYFNGHSIGHWEGDTLVVETIGVNPNTMLAPGVPHSDQLRLVERIRRTSPQWIEIETTMTDPVVLAEPYKVTVSYGHIEGDLREYVCLENNRDGADEKGRPSLNLEK